MNNTTPTTPTLTEQHHLFTAFLQLPNDVQTKLFHDIRTVLQLGEPNDNCNVLSVRVPMETVTKVSHLARHRRASRSKIVRAAILAYTQKHKR